LSLRPPELLAAKQLKDQGYNILESEMLAESSFLAPAFMAGWWSRPSPRCRAWKVRRRTGCCWMKKAAREVWAFFVQRELCGLRDQKGGHPLLRHPARGSGASWGRWSPSARAQALSISLKPSWLCSEAERAGRSGGRQRAFLLAW
jgi:hypothetical protein